MARPSLDEIFATSQQKPSLDSIFGATQQANASPNTQQMAQQAASMPQGQMQVPQIPVNPGSGYGMPTIQSVQANAMLPSQANEAAMRENITNQGVQNKAVLGAEQNFGQTDGMINNLLSSIKGAYAQSAGGGMINGTAANIASAMHLPDTGLISGLKTTARDTAAAYAKVLTGGSRGVLGMFNRVLETIPHDTTPTPQQAGSALTEMYLTGAALEKGIRNGGVSPDQLKGMTTQQVQDWVSKNSLTADEQKQIYQSMATKFQNISPRQPLDMYGNIQPIKPNPLSLFADKAQNFFNQAPSAKTLLKSPDGKLYHVANKEVDDALEKGWTKNE